MKKSLLKRILDIIDEEPNKSSICCYRIRLDLKIDDGLDITNESQQCLACNGYPEGCVSYTTLDHILHTYRTFRSEPR